MPTSTLEFDIPKIEIKDRLEEKSPLQLAFARFAHNKLAIFALVLMAAIILMAVFAPAIAPYDPIKRAVKDPPERSICGTLAGDGRPGPGYPQPDHLWRPGIALGGDRFGVLEPGAWESHSG